MAAPASGDWNATGQTDEIDFTVIANPPSGVTTWKFRYADSQGGGWSETDTTSDRSGMVEQGEGSKLYNVQMRWEGGTSPNLPSEWSATKQVQT